MKNTDQKTKAVVISTHPHSRVRHIPRNNYRHCDIDPILRYMYKYDFDLFCEKFVVYDKELGAKEIFTSILEVANWLKAHSTELGIPILAEGLICHHETQDIKTEPYFICTIVLDALGNSLKPRRGDRKVYSVMP